MRNFCRIAEMVDVIPLLASIKRRPELWREDTYLRDYPQGPFGDTDTIMLRFPVKTVLETEVELAAFGRSDAQHESVDYPAFAKLTEARPIVFGLMAKVQGERLGRVMINRLRPGGRIFPHADTEAHAEYFSRFHVVLETSPGANIRTGDETIHMQQGEVWWFDNSIEHEVLNNGSVDRIHMVVDIRTSAR